MHSIQSIAINQSIATNQQIANIPTYTSATNQLISTKRSIATYQSFSIDLNLCNCSYHCRRVDPTASRQIFRTGTRPIQPTSPSPSIRRSAIARIIVDEWIELLHVLAFACITLFQPNDTILPVLLHQFKAVQLHFCHQSIDHHQFSDRNLPVLLHRFEAVQSLVSSSPSGPICFT